MAAGFALQNGERVTVFDPNGTRCRKLRITGKGRCNVTNNCGMDELLSNITTNAAFLRSAMARFCPQDVMALFEGLGVPLKTERGNRVFPQSDKSEDICAALGRFAAGAKIITRAVSGIQTRDGQVCAVLCGDDRIECDRAIIATGGCSYPVTGSTGDGHHMAERLGHTIVQPVPSLVPLTSGDNCCARLQGLSLRNVRVSVRKGQKQVFSDFGELLFTHFGITGPVVLSASAHMRDFKNGGYVFSIDLKPALDQKELDARLLRDFSENINRDFGNSLNRLLPAKMIPVIIERCGIDPRKKVNSITKQERGRLCGALKEFEIKINGTRPIAEAIVTSGGVSTKQINPKTMESKLVKGLYFAGEVMDVDAYTGGFNLQIAWATGAAAGRALTANDDSARFF